MKFPMIQLKHILAARFVNLQITWTIERNIDGLRKHRFGNEMICIPNDLDCVTGGSIWQESLPFSRCADCVVEAAFGGNFLMRPDTLFLGVMISVNSNRSWAGKWSLARVIYR